MNMDFRPCSQTDMCDVKRVVALLSSLDVSPASEGSRSYCLEEYLLIVTPCLSMCELLGLYAAPLVVVVGGGSSKTRNPHCLFDQSSCTHD